MLTSAELQEMERLVGVNNFLPKREARQLIAAYRDVLLSTPHMEEDTASGYACVEDNNSEKWIIPDVPSMRDAAISAPAPKARRDRRKKNEPLDTETQG